ncbi:MAG: hypothetical protein HWD92_02350 [Flavobacteriia bacterium]|nr:hypothetical protein [Flavobacteriia bacterium]
MKVLLIDSTHPLLEESLKNAGLELVDGTKWTEEEVLSELHNFEGVVIRSRVPVDTAFFEAASKLKCIGRFGAGLENINLKLAEKHGVTCLNVPEGNRQAVAEHALGLLLNLMNHIRRADIEVRSGVWKRHENTGLELSGKTVGIIGLGNMGQAFARVLAGFDVQIIACDPYIEPWPTPNIERVTLSELKAKADVISMHVPLTDETRSMVDADFWREVEKPVFFINTARGPVVNTEDLLNAIESGIVLGAGLDVLEFERKSFKMDALNHPIFKRLVESDQVILSPHVGGWTKEAFEKMGRILGEKMAGVLRDSGN